MAHSGLEVEKHYARNCNKNKFEDNLVEINTSAFFTGLPQIARFVSPIAQNIRHRGALKSSGLDLFLLELFYVRSKMYENVTRPHFFAAHFSPRFTKGWLRVTVRRFSVESMLRYVAKLFRTYCADRKSSAGAVEYTDSDVCFCPPISTPPMIRV